MGKEETISVSEWLKTLEDFQGMCAYCQTRRYQEQDHFIPRHKGGRDDVTNYLPACTDCNKRKSDLTGNVLIATFGEATIDRLRIYLEERFQQNIMFPEETRSHIEGPHLVIRELAEKQGIKQSELAAKSGVSPSLINHYWRGKVMRVELDALAKIAKALGCKLADLIST